MSRFLNDIVRTVSNGGNELARAASSSDTLDAIPLASQGKSLLQALTGDRAGAVQTQDNFTRRCVVLSQMRSAVEHHNGNEAAAAQTQAEFARALKNADETAKAALSAALPVARELAHAAELARGAQRGAAATEQAACRLRDSELAAGLSRGAQRGAAAVERAAERAAQRLSEMELGRKFADLVQQQPWRQGASCGSSSASRSMDGPIESLDDFTIATQAFDLPSGAQCSCCLEAFQEGDAVRVLPCFHMLHGRCAEKWLFAHPICPVCRCDIRTSLEGHRR